MCVSPFEQMILFITQLYLALPVTELCYRFNISKTTASRIILETLNILYVRLKFLIYWPDPSDRQNSMPMCFRAKFRTKITVIIDCFEIFIEWPSNLTAHCLTWSCHKELPALFLKVGVDRLVIKGLFRIQIFCQS